MERFKKKLVGETRRMFGQRAVTMLDETTQQLAGRLVAGAEQALCVRLQTHEPAAARFEPASRLA